MAHVQPHISFQAALLSGLGFRILLKRCYIRRCGRFRGLLCKAFPESAIASPHDLEIQGAYDLRFPYFTQL